MSDVSEHDTDQLHSSGAAEMEDMEGEKQRDDVDRVDNDTTNATTIRQNDDVSSRSKDI